MRYGYLLAAVAGLALSATGAAAQTDHVDVSFTATVPQILHIENTGGVFTFNNATMANFDTDHYMQSITGPTLRTRGNVNYTVSASAPDLSISTGGTKAAGDVTVFTDALATSTALSNAGNAFYDGNRGGNMSKAVVARMALDYLNDVPGDYTTTVTFTITAR